VAKEIARDVAYGLGVASKLKQYPEIAQAYGLYDMCRSLTPYTRKSSKGKDTMITIQTFPTGYALLPEEGSLLDQPYRLMEFFGEFMDGERLAFFRPRK
jgi:hypothetical protein